MFYGSLTDWLFWLSSLLQAEDLHRQLMHRQKNVEYRLKEFEADVQKNFPVGTRLRH